MNLALVVVTDGRADYCAETLDAAAQYLPEFDSRWIINDSGVVDYGYWLQKTYPGYRVVSHTERRGMAGAVRSGFEQLTRSEATHAMWLEEDMVLLREPPIRQAVAVLEKCFELAQVTFKRKPWWGREVDLGDQLAAIVEQAGEHRFVAGSVTEHDFIFSLNPCVIPRRVFELGWPDGNEAEQTRLLLAQGFRFAMWGKPGDPDYVEHIGAARSAGWRL